MPPGVSVTLSAGFRLPEGLAGVGAVGSKLEIGSVAEPC